MRELLSLNKYFARYKGTVILGVLYLTVSNFFLVFIPILIRMAIDEAEIIVSSAGVRSQGLMEILFSADAGLLLAKNASLLIFAVLVYGYLLFLTRQTLIVTSRHIEYDMRTEIYEHLQKLPARYFATNSSGDIYVRVSEDINRVREYFGPAFMYNINTITRAGIIIGIMLMVNVELTLWALLPMPVLSVLAYWISGYINKESHSIQEQYSHLAGRAQEAFSSIRLIKAYVREDHEFKRFSQESETYRRRKLRLSAIEALFFPMLSLLIGFSVLIVVWQGGIMIIEASITVGNIAEFIIYVAYLTWPVASLGYTLNLMQRSAASNKRIQELLAEPVVDQQAHDGIQKEIKGHITLKEVSFSYDGTTNVLNNISLDIPAGTHLAIIGRTGSGKSSLVQLLPRLFEPNSGEILIDGEPLSTYDLRHLRQSIGFVPQENFLFSDSIRENIAFGVEQASNEDIYAAAEKAQVLDNILSFEKKFETILGERGITLSGGQKQRTSIARALLKKPSILIFDDSLSAVDTKTEEAILNHLNVEMRGKTTITISHRISTVQHADEIVVMKEGSIVERGTHKALLEQKGYYFDMYRKQLLEEELADI